MLTILLVLLILLAIGGAGWGGYYGGPSYAMPVGFIVLVLVIVLLFSGVVDIPRWRY